MNIIICGAGRVGFTIAKLLSEQNHSITVIDQSSEDIQKINDALDVKAIVGKATFPNVLETANANEADMIIAVTRNDETNMLICQMAYSVFKIQKKIGKHILSFSAMGAPQKHGQRSYKSKIAKYDIDYAQSLGDNTEYNDEFDRGINYNKHWGYLDRWTLTNSGDTIHNREVLNTRQNYYHKPQFSLRDFIISCG